MATERQARRIGWLVASLILTAALVMYMESTSEGACIGCGMVAIPAAALAAALGGLAYFVARRTRKSRDADE